MREPISRLRQRPLPPNRLAGEGRADAAERSGIRSLTLAVRGDGSAQGTSRSGFHLWLMAAYGFVAGLPLPLSGFTLRLWLSEGGVSLAVIGLTANIGLAYSLKFLWAPLLDNARRPGPLRRLGRRRGWLLAIQPALAAAAALLALSNPAAAAAGCRWPPARWSRSCSASQDIVVDAWRIEVFPARLQGAAMAAYVWGYRVALLIATTGVIGAVGVVGWHVALLGVAALIALRRARDAAGAGAAGRGDAAPSAALRARACAHAVIEPLRDFLTRPGARLILAFVALFKLGEAMAGIMTAPFYRALGFIARCDRRDRPVLAGGDAGRHHAGRLAGGAHRRRPRAAVHRLGADHGDGDVPAARRVGRRAPRAVRHGDHRGVRPGHGRRGVHHLPVRAVLARVHRDALRAAVVAGGDRGAHLGGCVRRAGRAAGWVGFYALCMFAALPAMGLMLLLLRRERETVRVEA